jgi:hypothetical protein
MKLLSVSLNLFNKLLQSNDAKLLSSIAKHPTAYGFVKFPVDDITKVGSIELLMLV